MDRLRGPLTTAVAMTLSVASSLTAHAAESDAWSRGLGDARVGGVATYGPLGGLRVSTTTAPATTATWRVGYRFAERWWAGVQMEPESQVAGLGSLRDGLATLAGQYDFAGAYGLKPYVGAAASFRAQPTGTRLLETAPISAWVRVGVDYRLTPGLHSFFEVDGSYLRRGLDGAIDGQGRQNVGDTGVRDALQWRTGLLYRF